MKRRQPDLDAVAERLTLPPEALGALEMMEFEGKDAVEAYIRQRAGGGA